MLNPPFNVYIFIAISLSYSIFWGLCLRVASTWKLSKKVLAQISFYFMKYVSWSQEEITGICLGFVYYLTSFIGNLILMLIYKINIFSFFFIEKKYLIFILVCIFAEISCGNLIATLYSSFLKIISKNKIDLKKEIGNIKWIDAISKLPGFFVQLSPLLGGFFEEIFFRGIIYLVLVKYYSFLGPYFIIIYVGLLFGIQQVIQTSTFHQGVMLGIASMVISTIGCLCSYYTGSILPAVAAHCSFVVYYFQGMSFVTSKKAI